MQFYWSGSVNRLVNVHVHVLKYIFLFYFTACRLQFNKVRAQEMPSTTVRYDNWVLLFKHGNIVHCIPGQETNNTIKLKKKNQGIVAWQS